MTNYIGRASKMTTEPHVQEPEPETGRVTEWVVLVGGAENVEGPRKVIEWHELRDRITAATRREAERDALILADGTPVSVVPARSWDPKAEERPTEIRVVDFDPWAAV